MNKELLAVIEHMERERGLSRAVLVQAVKEALLNASKKSVGPARNLRIEEGNKLSEMRAMATLIAVDRVKNPHDEIDIRKARKQNPNIEAGQEIEVEVTLEDFGRIAAQTAKQTIMQRIRQAEKEMLYDEFKDRAGEIVSGTVRRFERSDVIIDLGKFEAIMPSRERVSTEDYNIGDRIRAYVLAVENGARGPEIILSRSHPNFVRRLFEVEVSEISDKTVEIVSVAREAGFRTKIAVNSKDDKVDPVGACVGVRGARVKNIVRELNNEKIDIIRWQSDPVQFVLEALKPAKVKSAQLDPEAKRMLITVDKDQLSIAIGKRGQNARLTSRLVGIDVSISEEVSKEHAFAEQVTAATQVFVGKLGLDEATARSLVMGGMASVADLVANEPGDIADILGIELEVAQNIYARALKVTEVSKDHN